VIVTNKNTDRFMVYEPNRTVLPHSHPVNELEAMHTEYINNNTPPAYLIYDGYHYNPIMYEHTKQLDDDPLMPEWIEYTTTTSKKRVRDITVIEESEEDSSDAEANEGTHQRHKRTKTEQKTEDIHYKKADETTKIGRRQRYKITTETNTGDDTTNQ
jgi:hypothetical protein